MSASAASAATFAAASAVTFDAASAVTLSAAGGGGGGGGGGTGDTLPAFATGIALRNCIDGSEKTLGGAGGADFMDARISAEAADGGDRLG